MSDEKSETFAERTEREVAAFLRLLRRKPFLSIAIVLSIGVFLWAWLGNTKIPDQLAALFNGSQGHRDTKVAEAPRAPRSADDVLNFDASNTYEEPTSPVDAHSYLGSFAVELTAVTPGTRVVLLNHLGSYEGKAFLPVSQPNVLTQVGSNEPVSFTLKFRRPLEKLGFFLPPLIAATKEHGITFPMWTAQALDKNGGVADTVVGPNSDSYIHDKAKAFYLEASCISAVRFDSENSGSAFSAILIDDLTLWYATEDGCK